MRKLLLGGLYPLIDKIHNRYNDDDEYQLHGNQALLVSIPLVHTEGIMPEFILFVKLPPR